MHSAADTSCASIDVRPARPQDAQAIAAMARELATAHLDYDPSRFYLPNDIESVYRDWLSRVDPAGDLLALVAMQMQPGAGERLVGYTIAEHYAAAPHFWSPAHVFVHDICVDRDLRNAGVGRLLIDHVAQWARCRGAVHLRGLVAASNTRARDFFKGVAFREAAVEVTRDL
ncbi:MAG: GNAT family N-acetyltransferase [Phycisphaerales bacterium]|nr:GNAT family N-acetyltransferase [Phycisphaerales bacterium]